MHQLNIIMLTTSFPLSKNCSSGIFVARLADNLTDTCKIKILTPSPGEASVGKHKSNYDIKKFRYGPKRVELLAHRPGGIPVALSKQPWLYLLVVPLLFSMLITLYRQSLHKKNLVIHANWGICGCVAGIVGKLVKCPVVTTLRGEDFSRSKNSALDKYILKNSIRLSSVVVTVSKAMADNLKQSYPQWKDKLYTISNGVDDKFLKIGAQRNKADKNHSLRLITVGSLIPRKGIDQIIQAMAKSNAHVSLTIVGEGIERKRLIELVSEYELGNRIRFEGAVAPELINSYLKNSDILILASHSEGRPNVILEAMAAGLPVIASNIDGVRELVQDSETGFLFNIDDIDDLIKHINYFVVKPTRCIEYGRNAYEFILSEGLVWEETANRYQALYKLILNR